MNLAVMGADKFKPEKFVTFPIQIDDEDLYKTQKECTEVENACSSFNHFNEAVMDLRGRCCVVWCEK